MSQIPIQKIPAASERHWSNGLKSHPRSRERRKKIQNNDPQTPASFKLRSKVPTVALILASQNLTEVAFNITFGISKVECLQTSESTTTHAMVISGVHLEDGKAERGTSS